MNTPPAQDGRPIGRRSARPHPRGALYAATVLAPLGGVALLELAPGGGLATFSPVQQAAAQQPTAQPPLAQPPLAQPPLAQPPPEQSPPAQSPPIQAMPAQPPPVAGGQAPPVAAATPGAAEAVAGGALSVLIDQAGFWRSRQRYDQAIVSLNRALKLAPTDPDALALMAQVQSEKGDQHAALAFLERLRRVAPADPRIAKIDQAIRLGPISQDQLAQARSLAQSGKQAEAVQQYNRVFKGNAPPDALAVEYYQTLAGAEGGYAQAKQGLAKLVRQNPQDLRAQLAYAQVLTYRDADRLEGIERLAALAQNPTIAEQATQSWRQALGWLPDARESIPPLQSFLATHPGDTAIANKLEQAKNPLLAASPPVRARLQGFDELNKGKLADAEKLFQQAIDADANDADATGGLGLVRLRQRNFAEAKTLLERAIALDPEHKGRWQSALTAAANPGGGVNPATALINHGDFAAAERELSRQVARGDNVVGLQAMLADAQARQGRLDDAEATYRAALARAPNNAQVLVGLAGVLSRQGRDQEASALLDRAQAVGGSSRLVGQARALQLREQANAITDPATKVGLYRAAVALDPDNPWLRLDMARALFKLGQTDEARAVMAGVLGSNPTPDALKAGIIFANETSDPDAAAALIARLPPGMRTPQMRVLQMRAALQREIGAAMLMSRPMARQRLLAMAAVADPEGVRGAAIARALGEIGDKMAAREAVVAAQASTPRQGPGAKLLYASALMDIDDPQGAANMLAQIGSRRALSPADRQQFVQLEAGLAVRASDKLNAQGRQADAYDHLAPVLAQAPENPALNLALARLYQGAKNPREALQISESLLRREPSNVDARRGAVAAALQLGDRRLADQLAQEGRQLAPDDPKTWMMAADVDKARGDNERALRDLERARELRLQQLGYSDSDAGADSAPPPGVSLMPGDAPTYLPTAPRPVYRRSLLPSADGGADQMPDLSVPPMLQQHAAAAAGPPPPFTPQSTTAVGTSPAYQPALEHPLLNTASDTIVPPSVPRRPSMPGDTAEVLNAEELGRTQALGGAPPYQSPARPFRLPPEPTPAAPSPAYQPSAYQPPAPQPPAYQPPAYQPPAYRGPWYRPQAEGAPVNAESLVLTQNAPLEQPLPAYQPPPQPSPAAVRPAMPFSATDRSDGYYANPFRQVPRDTFGETGASTLTGVAAPDQMTQQIDRDIIALRDTLAPSVQGGFGFRGRSGSNGLDALSELTVPMEATFSPGGFGKLRLAVTPVLLSSGTIGGDITNQQRFGTNALALRNNAGVTTLSGPAPGDQNAQGLALDLRYSVGSVSADIGATPTGFREQNLVGGVEWAPQLSDHVRLRLLGERRAVTDSILSHAGTVDPRTGTEWGGVVQNHGRATLEFSAGRADFYLLVGGADFTGAHVQHNTEIEAGAGGSVPIYRTPTQEVRLGLDLIYFGYSHNQDFFTLGQGGYFSPQSFTAAMVPVTYKEQVDEDLSYEIGASAGLATFRETAQPYHPIDSSLEAALIAQQSNAGTAVPGVLTQFPGMSQSGFSGTAHGSVDYRVSSSLHLGARLNYEHSPAYDQTTAMVYAKYLFNGADK